MAIEAVSRVGVVGAGRMGAGIAEVCARAGIEVLVCEPTRELLAAGRARIQDSLGYSVSSGRLTEREREQTADRLRFTTDITDFADRQLVCEAVTEDEFLKKSVFVQLDDVVCDTDAVIASGTSSIPIAVLAAATSHARRVIGLHFFHPVPVLPLVEVVTTTQTAPAVADRAEDFAHDVLGKQVIRCADRPGFIVNSMLVPFVLSAIRLVENGFASAEDIDKGMVLGCAHPVGPLKLADLVGLDTIKTIADRMYADHAEPLYAPPPLLAKLVDSGWLGKKTGQGFYDYGFDRDATDHGGVAQHGAAQGS